MRNEPRTVYRTTARWPLQKNAPTWPVGGDYNGGENGSSGGDGGGVDSGGCGDTYGFSWALVLMMVVRLVAVVVMMMMLMMAVVEDE